MPPPTFRLFSNTTSFDSKVIFFLNNASPTMTTSYYIKVKFFVFEALKIQILQQPTKFAKQPKLFRHHIPTFKHRHKVSIYTLVKTPKIKTNLHIPNRVVYVQSS